MRARYLPLLFFFFLLWNISQAQNPASPSKYFQKGMAAYHLGLYDEALVDFKEALDDDPDSWEAYQQEGYCFYHLGKQKEMKSAFAESLKRHPDNPELNDFITALNKVTPTPAIGARSVPPPSSFPGSPASPRWGSSPWLNLSSAFSFSALGDLVNAAGQWNTLLAQYHDQGGASAANMGFQFGFEFGQPISSEDTLSLSAAYESGHGFDQYLVYSSPVTIGVGPNLFLFGANYYRYFPEEKSRLFLTIGVLFGLAIADYYQEDPIAIIQGPLSGTGVGFALGLGKEWKIDSNIGFQLAGHFRYLSISQLQNSYLISSGGSGGHLVLAIDPKNNLGLATPEEIGQNGLRYATLDYTGFNVNFSLNFYLF